MDKEIQDIIDSIHGLLDGALAQIREHQRTDTRKSWNTFYQLNQSGDGRWAAPPKRQADYHVVCDWLRQCGGPTLANPFYPGIPCLHCQVRMALEAEYYCSESCWKADVEKAAREPGM